MTSDEFGENFSYFSLSDVISQELSSNKIKKILKQFTCESNLDLQDFLYNRALAFERSFRTKTYIFIENSSGKIAGYYSIAIHTLHTRNLSKSITKSLDGYTENTEYIPCFLLGQLGKSDEFKVAKIGKHLLDNAISKITEIQKKIGGRFILLDSVNEEKVVNFYKENNFSLIEEDDGLDNIRMVRPFFVQ